jgi:Raf kinase inhibitor-like YbhB/YbcL family protein
MAGCASGGGTESSTTIDVSPTVDGSPTETTTGPTETTTTDAAAASLTLTTPAFDAGGTIPPEHTCEGADVSPELHVAGVPDDAAALALVVDDPDAPTDDPFVHWLLWNLPPDVTTLPRGVPASERVDDLDGAVQGTNGFDEVGYRGPCPPTDDGAHTYRFTLSALDAELDVAPGSERPAISAAIDDHELTRTRLTGEFDR